jgi:DNA-binding transcriptional regulator LsrR (DeoR family)
VGPRHYRRVIGWTQSAAAPKGRHVVPPPRAEAIDDSIPDPGEEHFTRNRKGIAVAQPAGLSEAHRTISTVAWLYHTRGLRQSAIAERLHISQSRVSRLLDQAVELGIVRTTVVLPKDKQSILEQELEFAYNLKEVYVHDLGEVEDETQLVHELGQLLAMHLQSAPLDAGVIGLTSWSRALGETVRNLRPLRQATVSFVVEMVGDLGPPTLQHLAAQNTQQLASLCGAEPIFLRVPGVLPSQAVKKTLLDHDSHARSALAMLDQLDFAMTGIGAVGIVPPLRAGDNFFTAEQVARAKKMGAVGELNLCYIAEDGTPVNVDIEELVIGASLDQLRRADRRLGVAGGPSKYRAIRAALLGEWLNMLVTDSATAQWLIDNRDVT